MGRKRNLDTIAAELKGAEIDLGPEDKLCGCGCKAETAAKRRFLQGHDRRFIANMVNAELVEAKIELFTNSGSKGEFTGKQLAEKLLTEQGMLMFNHHLASAENPAKRPSRAKAPKAEVVEEAPEPTGPKADDPIRVKVGRWEKDAHIVSVENGEVTEVRYLNAQKQELFTTKFTVVS